MPGRFIPTSSGILGSVLIVAGLGLVGIGIGWVTTTTAQRLEGVAWLAGYNTDLYIGIGWIIAGLVAFMGGAFNLHRRLETAGTVAAIMWPLTVGGLFLVAQFFGGADNAWITTVSYSALAYVVLAVAIHPDRIPTPHKCSRELPRPEGEVP